MAKYLIGRSLRKTANESGSLQRALWYLDHLAISVLISLFRLLPVEKASAVGRRIGHWLGPRLEKNRHLLRNLELAFPELQQPQLAQLAAEVWGNGGAVLAEYAHMERLCQDPQGRYMEICISEEIAAFSEGSPAVFVAAHMANWELVPAAAHHMGAPMTALFSPPENPWIERRLARQREGIGCELLPADASLRQLIRTIKAGRSIGIVMDRRVDSGRPVPMFGMDKLTTLVPARLALREGCELVPVQIERLEDTRFRITFHEPILPGNPLAPEQDRALDMTRQINEHFERWIRQAPQDWLCTKRLWDKGQARPEAVTEAVSPPLRQAS